MTVTNNPNYTCVTSKTNPYLDVITFKQVSTAIARQTQIVFFFERASCVTNSVPYIVSCGDGKPSPIYTQVMTEVSAYPSKYNCTRQELEQAYKITFQILNAISVKYSNSKTIYAEIFKGGVVLLNDKFFEDVSNGKLNKLYFINGMKIMADYLNKYRSILL